MTTAKRTPTQRLLNDLEVCRYYCLLALQDAALDEGDDDTAMAWGWLAQNKRWPSQDEAGLYRWRPHVEGAGKPDKREDVMPGAVLEKMAVRRHAKVVDLFRETVEVLPEWLKTVGPWQTGL
jgi:hypothetical protein